MNSERVHIYRKSVHPDDWDWLWSRIFGPDSPDDGRPLLMIMKDSAATYQLAQRHNARRNGIEKP